MVKWDLNSPVIITCPTANTEMEIAKGMISRGASFHGLFMLAVYAMSWPKPPFAWWDAWSISACQRMVRSGLLKIYSDNMLCRILSNQTSHPELRAFLYIFDDFQHDALCHSDIQGLFELLFQYFSLWLPYKHCCQDLLWCILLLCCLILSSDSNS